VALGSSDRGQLGQGALGDGSTLDALVPIAVAGGLSFRQLTLGGYFEGGHA
jgi:hypothetical protein